MLLQNMTDVKDFILNKVPVGVIVLDRTLNILFSNKQAELIFKRYTLPGDHKIFGLKVKAVRLLIIIIPSMEKEGF